MATVGIIALVVGISAAKIISTGFLLAIGFALGKLLIDKISQWLKGRKAMESDTVKNFISQFTQSVTA